MALIEIRDVLDNETGKTIFPRTHVNAVIGMPELRDGKSAYEIWLDEGNTGTEEDFLESLRGNSGYRGEAGELEVVNNVTDGGSAAALSAEMGKQLNNNMNQNVANIKKYDNWDVVSRANVTFPSSSQISIGDGYLYFRRGSTINYSVEHISQTYSFSGSSFLCYNVVSGQFSVKNTPDENDLVLIWYDGVKGFRAGLLYNEYVLSSMGDADTDRYDNFNAVSRASVSFPEINKVTIGTGYIFLRRGNVVAVTINHTEQTYTFTGSSFLCYNIVSRVVAIKNEPADDDVVLLWYDGSVGFRAGLLFDEYILSSIDLGNIENYDNFNAVSRASVTFPATNMVTIGTGNIYIRKGNTVVKTISHISASYQFSSSGFLCYNITTGAVAQKSEPGDNDVVLLWYDGSVGFRAGLLIAEFILARSSGGGGTSVSNDNMNAVSRATISFPESNKVSFGSGYIYIRKGDSVTYTINMTARDFVFTQSSMLCYNISTRDVSVKSTPGATDLVLLWFDGVVGFRAGLLYDEYLRIKVDDSTILPMSYVIPNIGRPDDAVQPMVHGATAYYPQNCATLYKLASKNRFNFWENDVRPCLDGYVLAHNDDMAGYALDPDGNTIQSGQWLCGEKTVAQLKTLKVGIKPNTSTIVSGYENEKILTFEEYIILAKAYNAVPVVELKFGATQAQVGELYAICEKHGMDERVIWNCYGARFQHATYIHDINPNAYILFTFNPSDEQDDMKTNLDACANYIHNRNQVMVSLPWSDWGNTVDGVALIDYAHSLGLRTATWPTSSNTYIQQAKAGICNVCSDMYYGIEDNIIYYLQKHSSELVS